MNDKEKQFDEQTLFNAYKNALLFKKENKINDLWKEIVKLIGQARANTEKKEFDDWLNECRTLEQKAIELGSQGVSRNCNEFDFLKKESKKMGGYVTGYLYSAFDNALSGNQTEKKTQTPDAEMESPELNLNDLQSAIQNNSLQSHRCPVNPEQNTSAGTLPKEWKKTKFNPQTKKLDSPRTLGECMYQYCYYGLWNSSKERDTNMKKQLQLYMRLGGKESCLEEDKITADTWLDNARKVFSKISDKISPELQRQIESLGEPLVYCAKKEQKNKQNRMVRKEEIIKHDAKIQQVDCIPATESPVLKSKPASGRSFPSYTHHPNDISQLTPAKHWKLYIDESYIANKKNPDSSFLENGDAVMGGVLFDADNPLPKQPPLHVSQDFTEEKMTQADKVIETITHSKCGVLVLPVKACTSPQGWGTILGAYIDLVLRLLPLDEKCKVEVLVEERDPYRSIKDCALLRDACNFYLMQSLPERASKIELSVDIQSKKDPYNAYPDIVSHTCRMRQSKLGKPRFHASKWDKCCFLNFPAVELRRLLDLFYAGSRINPADWDLLLQNATKNNVIAALLPTIGEEARGNLELWTSYLNYTVRHLDSKAINLGNLKKQLDWLNQFAPMESELPPRLRLLWLTAKLAEENHRGCVSSFPAQREEFKTLSEKLFEEDAPLTCKAALNLAVSYTDEFDFCAAKDVLAPWHERRPEVPGLQYYGQLLSSYGQHEAFLGDNNAAMKYFQSAIEEFKKLSEKDSAARDISQTSAYLLTVLMDLLPEQKEAFHEQALSYFGETISDAAARLSVSEEDIDKYKHHILLRYLTSPEAAEEEQNAYLSKKADWKVGTGHPWEMIEFYRAQLVTNTEERMKHLQTAYEDAMKGEGTLHVIAAVILGAILLERPEEAPKYLALVKQCTTEIPKIGERAEILSSQPDRKYKPMDLAAKILPFNFR